ncbi:hypothetical protein CsSME_00054297 [Camellia sinensis var. sinensis]
METESGMAVGLERPFEEEVRVSVLECERDKSPGPYEDEGFKPDIKLDKATKYHLAYKRVMLERIGVQICNVRGLKEQEFYPMMFTGVHFLFAHYYTEDIVQVLE